MREPHYQSPMTPNKAWDAFRDTLKHQAPPGHRQRDAPRGDMEGTLVLPDRPQTRQDTAVGRSYKRAVRTHAATLLRGQPPCNDAFLAVRLELYYSLPEAAPGDLIGKPALWKFWNIPRGDNAANLILTALTGLLYESPEQVQPLVVTRTILASEELVARFGQDCRRGCAVVSYG